MGGPLFSAQFWMCNNFSGWLFLFSLYSSDAWNLELNDFWIHTSFNISFIDVRPNNGLTALIGHHREFIIIASFMFNCLRCVCLERRVHSFCLRQCEQLKLDECHWNVSSFFFRSLSERSANNGIVVKWCLYEYFFSQSSEDRRIYNRDISFFTFRLFWCYRFEYSRPSISCRGRRW